jgi:hypothetical protein
MVYQPKTGERCSCKPGVQRDNCPDCEGTGWRIDFRAIRARTKTTATWGVWCEVWGGVTGRRTAWLRHNDTIAEYATREEAEAEARRCMDGLSPYRKAEFRYTAREME